MADPKNNHSSFASMRRDRVKDTMPSHFTSQYPEFVTFIEEYYKFMAVTDGAVHNINEIRDARNPDAGDEHLLGELRKEFGADFPNLTTMDESMALKVFIIWYRSKGNEEGIEGYFRLFLNSEAEVSYPGDNMLRCSDGVWNNAINDWTGDNGKLSESTMVIQDSHFFQTHSYLIKSGVSIVDWGDIYKKLAHPAGWEFFGEVQIKAFAQFEHLGSTPTITPGLQPVGVPNRILLAFAEFKSKAETQQVTKTWVPDVAVWTKSRDLSDVGINILGSTYTFGDIGSLIIQDITDGTIKTDIREPARITITP